MATCAPKGSTPDVLNFDLESGLNSPYAVPRFHHALDKHGQPLDLPPVEGRRQGGLWLLG